MFKKLKCIFGFHKWIYPIPSEKKCIVCKKHYSRVCYPFNGGFIFWERKK